MSRLTKFLEKRKRSVIQKPPCYWLVTALKSTYTPKTYYEQFEDAELVMYELYQEAILKDKKYTQYAISLRFHIIFLILIIRHAAASFINVWKYKK